MRVKTYMLTRMNHVYASAAASVLMTLQLNMPVEKALGEYTDRLWTLQENIQSQTLLVNVGHKPGILVRARGRDVHGHEHSVTIAKSKLSSLYDGGNVARHGVAQLIEVIRILPGGSPEGVSPSMIDDALGTLSGSRLPGPSQEMVGVARCLFTV